MPKNILIYVLSGKYNLGDEMILRSQIDFFQKKYPNANFHIATYDEKSFLGQKKNIHFLSFFPNGIKQHFLKNIWYFFQNIVAIWRADMIIIGGGGIFFDNEAGISFWKNLFEWRLRLFFARIFLKKVIFFGISLEVKNPKNQARLANIFSKNDMIFPRDDSSTCILQWLWIPAKTLYDSVFLNAFQKKFSKKMNTIGISLRPWFLSEKQIWELKIFIERISKKYHILFLSHSLSPEKSHNDAVFVESIFANQFPITWTISETLEAYECIDAMISMRLHANILASGRGIPSIMISYWPKTSALANILKNPLVIEAEMFSWEVLNSHFLYLENNFENMQEKIESQYCEIHTKFLQKLHIIDSI